MAGLCVYSSCNKSSDRGLWIILLENFSCYLLQMWIHNFFEYIVTNGPRYGNLTRQELIRISFYPSLTL